MEIPEFMDLLSRLDAGEEIEKGSFVYTFEGEQKLASFVLTQDISSMEENAKGIHQQAEDGQNLCEINRKIGGSIRTIYCG